MNLPEMRHRFEELRSTLRWLRSLPPEGVRYKVWLGDLTEFVTDLCGSASPERGQVIAILTGELRPRTGADPATRTHLYLERLTAFAALLNSLERRFRPTLPLIDITPPRSNGMHEV